MRTAILACIALLALASPARALHPVSTEGPFYGQVRQDETDLHLYDNNPHGDPCPDVLARYDVTLTYTPGTDTLGLAAGGQRALGVGGFARVTFWADYCTAFVIEVVGLRVLDVADYKVVVERSLG